MPCHCGAASALPGLVALAFVVPFVLSAFSATAGNLRRLTFQAWRRCAYPQACLDHEMAPPLEINLFHFDEAELGHISRSHVVRGPFWHINTLDHLAQKIRAYLPVRW